MGLTPATRLKGGGGVRGGDVESVVDVGSIGR